MNIYIVFLLPMSLFASGNGDTDILARSINFTIFAVIMYKLIKDPLMEFLNARKNGIADEFKSNADKIEKLKSELKQAKEDLNNIDEKSKSIVQLAKDEATKIEEQEALKLESDISRLKSNFKASIASEENKMIQELTKEVLEDMFKDKKMKLDSGEIVNIMQKRVG